MKYCPRCGSQISDNTIFCPNCGYKVGGNNNQPNRPRIQNTYPVTANHHVDFNGLKEHYNSLTSKQKQISIVVVCVLAVLIIFGWHYHSTHYLPYSIADQTIKMKGLGDDAGDDITYHMHSKSFTMSNDDDSESYNVEHVSKSDDGDHIVVNVIGTTDNSTYTKFTFDESGGQIEAEPSGGTD